MPFDLLVRELSQGGVCTASARARARGGQLAPQHPLPSLTPPHLHKTTAHHQCTVHRHRQTGAFIPEKSNVWRDCCDGMLDWVKEHVEEVGGVKGGGRGCVQGAGCCAALRCAVRS